MSRRPSSAPSVTILDACADPNLFAQWFKRGDWTAWFAFLAALFGLPMSAEQLAIYRKCTQRLEPPSTPSNEAWLVIGRRGGKSFMLALIAVFLACFRDYREYLQPGERGTILVIATDRKQARAILRYVRGLLTRIPMLARMIERETAESFDLNNSVTIEVATASFKTTRGYTIVAALCDELAFWPTSEESAEPDAEILAALRPGMATIPSAMLLCASSPYARRGALWDAHRRWFGKEDAPALVWQIDTRTMNPSVPQRVIDEATERDAASAAAEYGAQFRSDIEAFVRREAIESCVEPGCLERAPLSGQNYLGFVDPSGGSADSFTMAIGHRDRDGVAHLDCVREVKPPFSPESTVAEFALTLKAYRVNRVVGDRYAGEWPREQFSKLGISYEPSAKPKSDLYRDVLPVINSRRRNLLDHPKLITQLCSLERCTARGGRDSIDHPPGAHDDVANAVAGLVTALVGDPAASYYHAIMNNIRDPDAESTFTPARRMLLSGRLIR